LILRSRYYTNDSTIANAIIPVHFPNSAKSNKERYNCLKKLYTKDLFLKNKNKYFFIHSTGDRWPCCNNGVYKDIEFSNISQLHNIIRGQNYNKMLLKLKDHQTKFVYNFTDPSGI
jgi:hypothetical protein